jgi:hypothetical protein
VKRDKKQEVPDDKRVDPRRADDLSDEEWKRQFKEINEAAGDDVPIGMVALIRRGRRISDAYVEGVLTSAGVELPAGTMLYAKLPKPKENN